MVNFHKSRNSVATLFVHPNSHPYDSDLVQIDDDYKIVGFDLKGNKRNYYYKNCVNSGLYCFSPKIFEFFVEKKRIDLEKDILFDTSKFNNKIYGYLSSEYVKDVGTPDRIIKAEKDYENGIIQAKNLRNPQKCFFIDRDGTVNKHIGLLYEPEQLELEAEVADALKKINCSEYLAILITNQPVVARGLCSIDELEVINNKLQTILGDEGVYFDKILYCPHHPDKGYPEENKKYKVVCDCRKPKIGMIKEVEKYLDIDYENSWVIGDTTVDIMTGKNANLRTALLLTGEAGKDLKYNVEADITELNLINAVSKIIEGDL